MSLTKRVGLLAGTAALSVTSVSLAGTGADADRNSDLEARLAAAEARIAELTATTQDNWLTERRADEIRSLVNDVLADADTRSSLLNQGITAGYDDGAVLGSADGNWMLKTNILLQTRYVFNRQSEPNFNTSADRTIGGFENTRIKFILSGNVVSPDWFYRIEHEATFRGNGSWRPGTNVAHIGYDYGNGWKAIAGSMKAPLLREELVDTQYQLAVERSLASYSITGGYVNGLALSYDADSYRFTGAYSNGVGNFFGGQETFQKSDTEYAITGRGEYLAMGNWDQFTDFTSTPGSEMGVMIGAAAHIERTEFGGRNTTGGPRIVDLLILTVDASVEGDGWNAFASFTNANFDNDNGNGDRESTMWVVQGGWYWTDEYELFARYEYGDFGASISKDNLSIITLGVNKYFAGHNAKWSTDIGFALNEVRISGTNGSPNGIPFDITGYRGDAFGQGDQLVIRSQIQILF